MVILGGIYLLAAKKLKSNFLIWSVALVIAGGVGNLIDRIFRHFVIDYIEVRLINFAVFNFADCCVSIGVVLLFIYVIFCTDSLRKESSAKKKQKKEKVKHEQDHE